ncbi:MAG TPA: hypothetical protein VMT99_01135 [Candidatus Paceibacterota bacterium]|nr:hypothetical protein [Candidatus Paceibacterota bacterium]
MKKQRMEPWVTWRFDGNPCENAGNLTSMWNENQTDRWRVKEITITREKAIGHVRVLFTESWVECANQHFPEVDPQLNERLGPLVSGGVFFNWTRYGNGLLLKFQLQSGMSFCQAAVRNGVILITALGMGDSALRTPEVSFVPMMKRVGERQGKKVSYHIPWGDELRDKFCSEFYFGSSNHRELFPQHPVR